MRAGTVLVLTGGTRCPRWGAPHPTHPPHPIPPPHGQDLEQDKKFFYHIPNYRVMHLQCFVTDVLRFFNNTF